MSNFFKETMVNKSVYQLKWIAANKDSYSESEIKAALNELRKRSVIKSKSEKTENPFTKWWNDLCNIFYQLLS